MNLLESVRLWVRKNLPYDETDPNIRTSLDNMSASHLLALYLNWRGRLIPPLRSGEMCQTAFAKSNSVRRAPRPAEQTSEP
jgi:hypothetical protein